MLGELLSSSSELTYPTGWKNTRFKLSDLAHIFTELMFTERKSLLESTIEFPQKVFTQGRSLGHFPQHSFAEIIMLLFWFHRWNSAEFSPPFSQTLCCCYLVGAQRIYANKGFDNMLRNIKMHRRQQLLLGSLLVFMAISLLYRTQTVKLDTDPLVGFSIFNSTLTVIVNLSFSSSVVL